MPDSPSMRSLAQRRRRVLVFVFAACLLVQVGDAVLHPPHWLVTTLDTVVVGAAILQVMKDARRLDHRPEPGSRARMRRDNAARGR